MAQNGHFSVAKYYGGWKWPTRIKSEQIKTKSKSKSMTKLSVHVSMGKASGKTARGNIQWGREGKPNRTEPPHNIIYGIKFTFLLMLSVCLLNVWWWTNKWSTSDYIQKKRESEKIHTSIQLMLIRYTVECNT